MAKRASLDIRNKKSRSRKTAKRLEIKRVRLYGASFKSKKVV